MKKSRKYMAVYGMAGAAALTGLGIGMVLGPGSALADTNSGTSTTISTAAANATANRGTPPANRPSPGPRVDDLSIAAQTIGISEADLRSALQNGQSIADVAKAHNVDEQKVIDAIVATHTKAIDQAVTDGKLTQARADQMKTDLATRVKSHVEQAGMPAGRSGPRGGPAADGVNRPNDVAIAASTIGVSESDLRTALQNNQSIADVAKAHNVDEQKVIDAISAADTKAIDQAVTDGKLTQTQADQMKSNLPAHVKDEVERTGMPGPGGPGGHGPGGHGHGFGGPGGPGGQPPADGGSTSAAPTTGSTSA
jgi:uncharacterized protein YidB (DUF937 family)